MSPAEDELIAVARDWDRARVADDAEEQPDHSAVIVLPGRAASHRIP